MKLHIFVIKIQIILINKQKSGNEKIRVIFQADLKYLTQKFKIIKPRCVSQLMNRDYAFLVKRA